MKRRNTTFTVALCISLLVHGLIVRLLNDGEIRRLEAILHAGFRVQRPEIGMAPASADSLVAQLPQDKQAAEEPEFPIPEIKPKQPDYQALFGEKNGTGKAMNSSEGDLPMLSRLGDEIQAALTHQPGQQMSTASTEGGQPRPPNPSANAADNDICPPVLEKTASISEPTHAPEITLLDPAAARGIHLPKSRLGPTALPFLKTNPNEQLQIDGQKKDSAGKESEKTESAVVNVAPTPEAMKTDAADAISGSGKEPKGTDDTGQAKAEAARNPNAQPDEKLLPEAQPRAIAMRDNATPAIARPALAPAQKQMKSPIATEKPSDELTLPATQPATTQPVLASMPREQPAAVANAAEVTKPVQASMQPAVAPLSAMHPSIMQPAAVASSVSSIAAAGGEVGNKSPSESDPFTTAESFTFRDGKVTARNGRKVKTTKPRLTEAGMQALYSLTDPSAQIGIKVNEQGKVDSVTVLRSSGSNEVDLPIYRAAFDWEVEPLLDEHGKPMPDAFVINFNFR